PQRRRAPAERPGDTDRLADARTRAKHRVRRPAHRGRRHGELLVGIEVAADVLRAHPLADVVCAVDKGQQVVVECGGGVDRERRPCLGPHRRHVGQRRPDRAPAGGIFPDARRVIRILVEHVVGEHRLSDDRTVVAGGVDPFAEGFECGPLVHASVLSPGSKTGPVSHTSGPDRTPATFRRVHATVGPSPVMIRDGDLRATLVGFVGALFALAVISWLIGIEEILGALSMANPPVIFVVIVVAACWLTAWGLSFWTVLDVLGAPVPRSLAVLVFAGATFANNVTPFGQTGGEPVSALLVSRASDTEYETGLDAIASVAAF